MQEVSFDRLMKWVGNFTPSFKRYFLTLQRTTDPQTFNRFADEVFTVFRKMFSEVAQTSDVARLSACRILESVVVDSWPKSGAHHLLETLQSQAVNLGAPARERLKALTGKSKATRLAQTLLQLPARSPNDVTLARYIAESRLARARAWSTRPT